ncbi:hypothetical protein E2986_11180 [Frieseomelitta varia]|uniref:NADH dehydrogenase [ubiquinone] flavoprotein 3, mitochondrial n=1 Tax=Frieseomelitta varia TaxID=561572 RepID=A0A833VW30_9HYME|nr:hypothetical protein E2986_11180 [Frieseomelitta varia]
MVRGPVAREQVDNRQLGQTRLPADATYACVRLFQRRCMYGVIVATAAKFPNVHRLGSALTPHFTVAEMSEDPLRLPVGPCAAKDKEYKNPEYFCYHIDTFGEAEVELAKYRLPAPSNKVPFNK